MLRLQEQKYQTNFSCDYSASKPVLYDHDALTLRSTDLKNGRMDGQKGPLTMAIPRLALLASRSQKQTAVS